MLEQTAIEIVKFSPVVGTLIYIIGIMGKAMIDKDKRINELIDKCISPCKEKDSSPIDKDTK